MMKTKNELPRSRNRSPMKCLHEVYQTIEAQSKSEQDLPCNPQQTIAHMHASVWIVNRIRLLFPDIVDLGLLLRPVSVRRTLYSSTESIRIP